MDVNGINDASKGLFVHDTQEQENMKDKPKAHASCLAQRIDERAAVFYTINAVYRVVYNNVCVEPESRFTFSEFDRECFTRVMKIITSHESELYSSKWCDGFHKAIKMASCLRIKRVKPEQTFAVCQICDTPHSETMVVDMAAPMLPAFSQYPPEKHKADTDCILKKFGIRTEQFCMEYLEMWKENNTNKDENDERRRFQNADMGRFYVGPDCCSRIDIVWALGRIVDTFAYNAFTTFDAMTQSVFQNESKLDQIVSKEIASCFKNFTELITSVRSAIQTGTVEKRASLFNIDVSFWKMIDNTKLRKKASKDKLMELSNETMHKLQGYNIYDYPFFDSYKPRIETDDYKTNPVRKRKRHRVVNDDDSEQEEDVSRVEEDHDVATTSDESSSDESSNESMNASDVQTVRNPESTKDYVCIVGSNNRYIKMSTDKDNPTVFESKGDSWYTNHGGYMDLASLNIQPYKPIQETERCPGLIFHVTLTSHEKLHIWCESLPDEEEIERVKKEARICFELNF